jgi:hypothetical protein
MEANVVDELLRKVEICDRALANLASSNVDTELLERAIRDVRADAIDRLRAHGYPIVNVEL